MAVSWEMINLAERMLILFLKMRIFQIFSFLFCCLCICGHNVKDVCKLTTENGLSANSVKSIFKDSRGLMYFGTAVGVDRYDGERIINIHFPVDEIREHCWVSGIVEVGYGRLLVSNNLGLWDLNCRKLTLQRLFPDMIEGEVTDMWISNKEPSGSLCVYINMLDATFRLDNVGDKGERLQRLPSRLPSPSRIKPAGAFSYLRDDHGVEWCGKLFVGIEYTPYQRTIFSTLNVADPLGGTRMAGRFRVRTNNEGLMLVDTVSQSSFVIAGTESMAGCNIYDVRADQKGYYWISCPMGLGQLDLKRRSLRLFTTQNSQLPDNEVFCANFDARGRVWASTRGGLCFYDYQKDQICDQNIPHQLSSLDMLRNIIWVDDSTLCFLPQHGFPVLTDGRVVDFEVLKFSIDEPSPCMIFLPGIMVIPFSQQSEVSMSFLLLASVALMVILMVWRI